MSIQNFRPTRRSVVTTSLATGLASGMVLALPGCSEITGALVKTRTRYDVKSPEGKANLAIYREAVDKMLKLDLDDPRNWYRMAITHLLDCPHSNWWFFNWHRPFLGYFEQICQELTGEPDFALPYWDWTADPQLPDEFWNDPSGTNVLDPASDRFFADETEFMAAIDKPLDTFWGNLTAPQKAALSKRHGAMTKGELKTSLERAYYGGADARGPEAKAGMLATFAKNSVQLGVLQAGLASGRFDEKTAPIPPAPNQRIFNSGITADHSGDAGGLRTAIIEGMPHNAIHSSINGLMADFLSPTDPIFWLHHANIDRIWAVWSEFQGARGLPDQPQKAEATAFNPEPYLFFVDGKGKAITANNTAGDYMNMDVFGYNYAGGSQVQTSQSAQLNNDVIVIETEVQRSDFGVNDPAVANGEIAEAGIAALTKDGSRDVIGVADVTFTPIAGGQYLYHLFITGEGEVPDLSLDGGDYAGTFTFFGKPHNIAPTTVEIVVTDWFKRNPERAGEALRVHFSAEPNGQSSQAIDLTDDSRGSLQSVVLSVF